MKVEAVSKANTQIRVDRLQSNVPSVIQRQDSVIQPQEQELRETRDERSSVKLDHKTLQQKLQELEDKLDFLNRRFDYKVHEDPGELVVAIIDKQTGEIVRTVPPEYLLDIAAKIREFVGLIIDERY